MYVMLLTAGLQRKHYLHRCAQSGMHMLRNGTEHCIDDAATMHVQGF